MLNSNGVRKSAKALSKVRLGDVTQHLQTFGSLITSGTYMMSTLNNKDFDKNNATTLSVNQGMCFVIPTLAAYTVNKGIENFNKQIEYKYSSIQERNIVKMSKEEQIAATEKLGKRLRGFRTLIGIVTFTTIYRYVTPVAITPFANKIGKKINERKQKKEQMAMEKNMNTDNKAKEVSLNINQGVNKTEANAAKEVSINSPMAKEINIAQNQLSKIA